MQIKIIKDLKLNNSLWIRTGEVLTVRQYPEPLISFNRPYQVIERPYSGVVIPLTHCIVIDEEKTYTEKEWNDMENYYMDKLEKRFEEKKNLHEMIAGLTEQINKKNGEIVRLNFSLNLFKRTVDLAVERIKELEKA